MRVAMYYNNNDVRLEEMPKPEIGPGEIMLKTMASGICGSDVMEWYRIKKAPLVLGHEATGEIVEVGEGVERYKAGDRVFVSHHVPCNKCRYCLDDHHTSCETLHTTNFIPGGFSEYIRVPRINVEKGVYVLPENVSYDEGALIEPLACVVRGQRMAGMKPGYSVLILGSGMSGLLHVKLANAWGAKRVIATDVNDYRLDAAKRFGAHATIRADDDVPKRLLEVNENRLADLVIVCTGSTSAFHQALDSVDRGGAILFFAPPNSGVDIPVPVNDFWRNEITLLTSYGAAPKDLEKALDMIRDGEIKVGDLITHKLPLEEAGKGFKLVADAQDSLKVILNPQE